MIRRLAVSALAVLPLAAGQQAGQTADRHPKLTTQICSVRGGCRSRETSVVLDVMSHPIEDIRGGGSCVTASGGLNSTICPTAEACARNCAIEGVDYFQKGVSTRGNSLTLHQYMNIDGTEVDVTPRVYLLEPDGRDYTLLKLLNQEVAFDVDVSNLPCGMNGALFLSSMDASGGRSHLNPAGAAYGTGYCDAQCYSPTFINGVANIDSLGACCMEMDLLEANAVATQLTPHPCNVTGFYECSGGLCGSNGVCDKDGCGFNPYALGAHDFYANGGTVDTSKPFTVVTQFLTDNHHFDGNLNEIRRLYVQDGKVIQNGAVQFDGTTIDSITPTFCSKVDPPFDSWGGLPQMGEALRKGMVLIFSIWNDAGGYMNWLDSGNAGPCNNTQGNPAIIEAQDPGTSVTFSNIRWGEIGSTY